MTLLSSVIRNRRAEQASGASTVEKTDLLQACTDRTEYRPHHLPYISFYASTRATIGLSLLGLDMTDWRVSLSGDFCGFPGIVERYAPIAEKTDVLQVPTDHNENGQRPRRHNLNHTRYLITLDIFFPVGAMRSVGAVGCNS